MNVSLATTCSRDSVEALLNLISWSAQPKIQKSVTSRSIRTSGLAWILAAAETATWIKWICRHNRVRLNDDRSTTGCMSCKRRKKKCDEHHPNVSEMVIFIVDVSHRRNEASGNIADHRCENCIFSIKILLIIQTYLKRFCLGLVCDYTIKIRPISKSP